MADSSEPGPVDRETLIGLERDVGTEVVRSLIAMFIDSGPERVALARKHAADDDLGAAAEVLHSLKSSAASLGALRLTRLVEQAEHAARTGQAAELVASIGPIDAATGHTTDYLREYRDRLG